MNTDYQMWPEYFSQDQIKEINDCIENNYDVIEPSEHGAVYGEQPKKNNINVKIILYKRVKHLLSDLMDDVYTTAARDAGYITWGPYNKESLNFNTYTAEKKSHYDWHVDSSGSPMFDVKFTVLVNLSMDSYEGGQFQVFDGLERQIDEFSKPGTVFMLKSHICHRVLPIVSGERKSLTIWIKGPKFQ
jgi:predicted 2-oxoglutarate/Fe(II)-dependent dioxygenase YbiX